jgi:hypothetical protein
MLRIDRVKTEMEAVPQGGPPATAGPESAHAPSETFADPRARERIKELVLEALREHLRDLERRGVV